MFISDACKARREFMDEMHKLYPYLIENHIYIMSSDTGSIPATQKEESGTLELNKSIIVRFDGFSQEHGSIFYIREWCPKTLMWSDKYYVCIKKNDLTDSIHFKDITDDTVCSSKDYEALSDQWQGIRETESKYDIIYIASIVTTLTALAVILKIFTRLSSVALGVYIIAAFTIIVLITCFTIGLVIDLELPAPKFATKKYYSAIPRIRCVANHRYKDYMQKHNVEITYDNLTMKYSITNNNINEFFYPADIDWEERRFLDDGDNK